MKRKVLIIVENLPVPFDGRVWKEATTLRQNDYEVSVLCPKTKGYEIGYEFLDGIHIYRHPMPKERNNHLGYVWEFVCAFLWEVIYSWWILMRRGFHVIQGCNPPDNIAFVALPFKMLGVRYIFDHHDACPELYISKYGRKDAFYRIQVLMERATFRLADVVIATNNSYKELAITRGSRDPDDVFVVRNGPDLGLFQALPPDISLKHGKRFLVGYVGNMSSQEGLDILLDVAAHLKDLGRNDVHFTCIGGGPGLLGLQNMKIEMGLSDIVDFTGRVTFQTLLTILSTADICVNPDRPCEMNDVSTMIKIMEYMALKKPIVQFDLKEGRFSAGAASLYADKEDMVASFAERIIWLLDRPEERVRMGEIGSRRVETELAWEFSVQHLLAAYERAFSR